MDYKIKPWGHQMKSIHLSAKLRDLALFHDMGCGKTATIVNILRHKYARAGRVMRTLILCPMVVVPNWREEFDIHSDLHDDYFLMLTKSGAQRYKEFLKSIDKSTEKIVITNYHAMLMQDLTKALQVWKPEILVLDESHKCKNPKAKTVKPIEVMADQTEHNYILTGTPILRDAMDIFQQMRLLDRGETFGKNWWTFRNRYFEDMNIEKKHFMHGKYFPNWQPRIDSFKEFGEKMYAKGTRVLKKDCLDLPPLVREKVHVAMSPDQMKAYKQMKSDFIAFIDQDHSTEPKAVIAQQAMTKALRLQQIVSGYVPDEEGKVYRFEKTPRIEALRDLLEDLTPNNKVIVWACFHENYEQIKEVCNKLKIKYSELHGKIRNSELKQANLKAFQEDPEVKVMIANQAAGGIGVNMVEASYSIYFSRGFSLGDDLQSEARNYRGGSEIHDKVTRIDIVADGSIDTSVLDALRDKKNISDQILGWQNKV